MYTVVHFTYTLPTHYLHITYTLPTHYLHITYTLPTHYGTDIETEHQTKDEKGNEDKTPNIFQRFKDRTSAVDCVKLHSTLQGKRVMVDRLGSGGKKVRLVCATNHQSESQTKRTRYECNYVVVLSKTSCKKDDNKVRFPWAMNLKESNPQHSNNCISKAKMTLREARMHTYDTSVCTIEETTDRIATSNKIPKSCVPRSVAVQYRLGCLYTGFQNYDMNWGKLDKWGEELVKKNPGSKFHLEVDEQGRFVRMFVGIGSAARVAQKTGMEFSGIDATFFKHVTYKGSALILVTRDGDNKIMLLAWVIASKENSSNYEYMAEKIKEMDGLEEYLNRKNQLMYSDRHKGIPAFEKHFTCGTANCIVHIADNVENWVKKNVGAQVYNTCYTFELHSLPTHNVHANRSLFSGSQVR